MRFDNNFVSGMLFSQAETKRNDAFNDASAIPSCNENVYVAVCLFELVCVNVQCTEHNLHQSILLAD